MGEILPDRSQFCSPGNREEEGKRKGTEEWVQELHQYNPNLRSQEDGKGFVLISKAQDWASYSLPCFLQLFCNIYYA